MITLSNVGADAAAGGETVYPSWNCAGGVCKPNNAQAKTVVATLHDAITKAGLAVGATPPLLFVVEKLGGYIGPDTARFASKITEKLPGPLTGILQTLYQNATTKVPPVSLLSDQALAVTAAMYDVALGKYGGVSAGSSHKKLFVVGGLLLVAVAGGVALARRHR